MEIFLTFDDGIQQGTEQVLDVLRENKVNATFFLTGKFSHNYSLNNPISFRKCLSEIYRNHSIGNHSLLHANEFYQLFYSGNLIIDKSGLRRTVIQDFQLNRDWVVRQLVSIFGNEKICKQKMVSEKQKRQLARLPGRNSWRINTTSYDGEPSGKTFSLDEKDTKQSADEIFELGYQIFGWHEEWHMSFDFSHETRLFYKNRNLENSFGESKFRSEETISPDWDLCSMDNYKKDRLTEDWPEVVERLSERGKLSKLVLLMHDRAFRPGPKCQIFDPKLEIEMYDDETGKLSNLIAALKAKNYVFKTLDHY